MSDQIMHNVEDHSGGYESRVEIGSSVPFLAVFKREFMLYFRSPIAYGIAFAIMFFLSMLFNGYLAQANGQFPADFDLYPQPVQLLDVSYRASTDHAIAC